MAMARVGIGLARTSSDTRCSFVTEAAVLWSNDDDDDDDDDVDDDDNDDDDDDDDDGDDDICCMLWYSIWLHRAKHLCLARDYIIHK